MRSAREVSTAIAIAAAIVSTFGCASHRPAQELAVVLTGLDRVADGDRSVPKGRIGLIAHRASVTVDDRHAIDVLQEAGYEVAQIFSPEHGLRGEAAAGQVVQGGRDPISGLPVVSLYGENKAPRIADLQEIDLLVFDLQGAGVRFYTYVSTLLLSLDAAARAGLPFIVLDRPNPLGGERISGPVSAGREIVPESFVNLAPGPLVHGLTLGEMALLINAERDEPADVRVLEMTGWSRPMTWAETGRRWTAPSPNLRSASAALVYPGVALLEATNVSEGRGTEAPFLLFGAPWLNGEIELPEDTGASLESTSFIPTGDPAAPSPKYDGETCRGYRLSVSDPSGVDGYALGVRLVYQLSRLEDFEWRQDGGALTWLVGSPSLIEALESGRPLSEILRQDDEHHRAWSERRRPFLLY